MIKFVCPLITVDKIERSKEFYTEILGQKIKSDYGENVVFEGDFSIHDKTHFSALISNKKVIKGSNDFELYFESDNIDGLETFLSGKGIRFIHKIILQPWQQKVMRFYDPDMNIVEIGETLQSVCLRLHTSGKSVDEINKMTSLSVEFITEAIESEEKQN